MGMRSTVAATMIVLLTSCCSPAFSQVIPATAETVDKPATYKLEVRCVSLPTESKGQLPAALLKMLEELAPNRIKVTGCTSMKQAGLATVETHQVQQASFTPEPEQIADTPALCIALTGAQAKTLLENVNSDARSSIMQAPTVSVYLEQQAHVRDLTARPVVTAIHEIDVDGTLNGSVVREPVVSAVSEGLELSLQASALSEGRLVVNLAAFSRRVDEVIEIPVNGRQDSDKSGHQQGVTLQLPTTSVLRVTGDAELTDGESMLVVFPDHERPVRFEQRRMLGFVRKSALRLSNQWTGVLVTLHPEPKE